VPAPQSSRVAHDVSGLVGPDGWIAGQALSAKVNRNTIGSWVAGGKLVRLQPGVYATSAAALKWRVRVEAAVRSCHGVASHATALTLWDLLPPAAGPVHVTVEPARSNRGSSGVVLHRARDLADAVRRVDGLAVTSVERTLVDTWGRPGQLGRPRVRAAVVTAVRRGMCNPRQLADELARRPQLPARAELANLIRLLAEGCRSELEIWGCLHVLRGPGMPSFVQQRRIVVRGETFFLDAACEEVMMAVEMDGAAWHGSREQRERDIRRDALVATVGWQTLRFGYTRMTDAPEDCRRDILAVHAARLRFIQGGRAR
jgi:very-short-patch-repair endonuclease